MKDTTADIVRAVGLTCSIGAIVLGSVCLLSSFGVFHEKTFEPLHEEVRRKTFEQSRAYREGMAQELQSMQLEYFKASSEHQDALASIILHRTAGMPVDALPAELQQFVRSLRLKRGL